MLGNKQTKKGWVTGSGILQDPWGVSFFYISSCKTLDNDSSSFLCVAQKSH